jgi:hypothetical protein
MQKKKNTSEIYRNSSGKVFLLSIITPTRSRITPWSKKYSNRDPREINSSNHRSLLRKIRGQEEESGKII